MKLSDLFTVAPRYVRSINIERDLSANEALDGYVLTSTAYSVLGRLLAGLNDSRGSRAWNLTGSYGTGKSAFALLMANLLSRPDGVGSKTARSLLKAQRDDLYREFFEGRSAGTIRRGYVVVPISGSREPLPTALARACRILSKSVEHRTSASRRLGEISRAISDGGEVPPSEMVAAIATVAKEIQEHKQASGVVLIIDELGKLLEYAALNPGRSDIFLLQQLAEACVAGDGGRLAVITILHQAFEQYASSLPHTARMEWVKVQGRFEDIAFQEPADQVITLLGSAIKSTHHPIVGKMKRHNGALASRLFDLGVSPMGVSKTQFVEDMARCAPIDPVVVLALSRLARKFGQNQRSVFSFLTSREPFGFTEFLFATDTENGLPSYRLPELFDYTTEALGSALSQGDAATKWSAALTALDRAATVSEEEMAVLKSVGLLSAVGAHGEFKPSPELLRIAFNIARDAEFPALRRLVDRSLLIERRYNGTVGLWEGSDLDIDEQLRKAEKTIPQSAAVSDSIGAFWTPRPQVAKSHSFRTGTLRYFRVQLADSTNLIARAKLPEDADGVLVFAFGVGEQDAAALGVQSEELTQAESRLIISVVPGTERVLTLLRQHELLRYVESNTPELQSDEVARREIRNRKAWTERQITTVLESLTMPGRAFTTESIWFANGTQRRLRTAREFSEFLSSIFDSVYEKAPIIQNELVNRRQLSSAAAAARRNLLEAMIERPAHQKLGFTGQPPEVCIYDSVLKETGLHRRINGVYAFCPPLDHHSLRPAWMRLEQFLDATENSKGSVAELFETLQEPPFGLKMGIVPILFTAACLAYGNEIALYEDGIFTPELTIEAIERMLRYPNRFHIRRYKIEGLQRIVFTQIAAVVQAKVDSESANLVELMRPLYRIFNGLPQYSRQTRRLSQTALAVRAALSDAREPDQLIFSDLPAACGCTALASNDEVEEYIKRFHAAIHEIARAYDGLLEELKDSLFRALHASHNSGRAFLREQAELVSQFASDARLRAFCLNIAEDNLPEKHWIEAVCTAVVGKAPKVWGDADRARYDVTLAELARGFRNLLALAVEREQHRTAGAHSQIFRAGVADLEKGTVEETITVRSDEATNMSALSVALEEVISKHAQFDDRLVAAALTTTLRNHLLRLRESRLSGNAAKERLEIQHG